MTAEPSPRPWSLFVHDEQEGGDGEVSICAGGEWIATMNLRRSSAKADAALIVAAVNKHGMPIVELIKAYDTLKAERDRAVKYAEAAPHPGSAPWKEMQAVFAERDRLRDIVRRLARVADETLQFAEAMCGIIPDNPERAKARSEIEALLREARAAIGGEKQ